MTDNTEPTIDLYQKITDICFENGGATKPMVDQLYELISDQVAKARVEGRNATLKEVIDEIDNGLDDIKGCAEKRYYPFQEDDRRLEHISNAVNEIHQQLRQKIEEL